MLSLLRPTEKVIKCPHKKIACSLKTHSFISKNSLHLGRADVLNFWRITPNALELPVLQHYSHKPHPPIQSIFSFEEEACLQKRSCNKIMPHLKLKIHNCRRLQTSAGEEYISLLFISIFFNPFQALYKQLWTETIAFCFILLLLVPYNSNTVSASKPKTDL